MDILSYIFYFLWSYGVRQVITGSCLYNLNRRPNFSLNRESNNISRRKNLPEKIKCFFIILKRVLHLKLVKICNINKIQFKTSFLELLIKNDTDIGRVKGPWDGLYMQGKEVACSWGLKGQVMRRLMEYSENKKRILVDGARLIEDDSWVLLRPDRKKALFHILAESRSNDKSRELVKKYSSLIKNWQK